MTESEAPPSKADEEPDTPIEEIRASLPDVAKEASALAVLRSRIKALESEYEEQRKRVLGLFRQVPRLHGIRLGDGTAVRRTWSVRTTAKPDPARLREMMADADEYIHEVVDLPSLRRDYPSVWERAGKVRREETVAVRLAGEGGERHDP